MEHKPISRRLCAVLAVALATTLTAALPATAQTETVLHDFSFPKNGPYDGFWPWAGLVMDSSGNLYGTATTGGNGRCWDDSQDIIGCGVVFELKPKPGGGWNEALIHQFQANGTDGTDPHGGVILDASGNLYGTTEAGGLHNAGTIFELLPQASGGFKEKILHHFGSSASDGTYPWGGVILDATGNLYGTANNGGIYLGGSVFEASPLPSGLWTEKTIYPFGSRPNDGLYPLNTVAMDAAGNLYGTTSYGGNDEVGTVFEVKHNPSGSWTEEVLHSFVYPGTDGFSAWDNVTLDSEGNVYGTTQMGGSDDLGIVFELKHSAAGAWAELILHNFRLNGTDGVGPYGGLIFDGSGNLYGTTGSGGLYTYGTVFELSPAAGGGWTESILHNFGSGADGQYPAGDLLLDGLGNLYGTTTNGGTEYCDFTAPCGTVFEITP